MKKNFFVLAAILLVSTATFAKNVVPITTSCGVIAYIDTDRTTIENTMQQVMAIDDVLCGD
jgi:hypothetical protein